VERSSRRMKKVQRGTLVVLVQCLLVACTGANAGSTPDAGGKAVPADLKSFESNGEGLSESPATPDWITAQSILDQANGTWKTLKPTLLADGASAATVAKVDDLLVKYGADVQQKATRAAETDANSINWLVPDFFDRYASPVPSDALRLDAGFRLVEIQGEYSDWAVATTELERTKVVWGRLKPLTVPKVAARKDVAGGDTVVPDVDTALSAAAAAIASKDATELKKQAKRGLDLVDVVEQAFK
jgi:hypothetical protein